MHTRPVGKAGTRAVSAGAGHPTSPTGPGPTIPQGWVQTQACCLQGRYDVFALRPPDKVPRILLAKDRNIPERRVVLKVAPARDAAAVSALERERDLLSPTNHRGLPRVYGFFTEGGQVALVLEFVAERAPLARRPTPPERAVALLSSTLEILDYLHQQVPPVVHGDLKPGNLLAHERDPHVTLIDFGGSHAGTVTGPVQGTPGYTSPEHRSGGLPRPSWDLYGAAVVLHELLTGMDPRTWDPSAPPCPETIPAELQPLLRRALDPNPRKRPATAKELRSLLENAWALTCSCTRCPSCDCSLPTSVAFCHRCGRPARALAASRPPATRIQRVKIDPMERALARSSFAAPPLQHLRQELDALCRPLGFNELMTLDQHDIEPMEHQVHVTRRVLQTMQGRALLADEVGLGKTIEAALIRAELKARGLVQRTLILTPPHLREQWQEELQEKFHESFPIYQNDRDLGKVDNLIMSHATARGMRADTRVPDALKKRHWDLVIVDEAHHARNRSTLLWRLLSSLQTSYYLLLTATPLQNSVLDLFNLVTLVRPGALQPSQAQFERCYQVRGTRVGAPEDLKRDAYRVMVRTRRSEAYVKFPERDALVRPVSLSPDERSLYDGITQYIRRTGAAAEGQGRLTLIQLQQRLTSSPDAVAASLQNLVAKAPGDPDLARWCQQARSLRGRSSKLEELLRLLGDVKDRVVVFSDHVPTQEMLRHQLGDRGYLTWLYRGTHEEKRRAVKAFAEKGQVLVVSAAGNEGLNLHHWCHVLVNYDLPWNPMKVEQRIGRLQRLGQSRKVLVFNLAAEDTVESQVLRVLQEKIRLFELAIGQVDLILGELLPDEHSFEERVWKCLLSASNNELLARRMESEFQDLAKVVRQGLVPGMDDLL